MINVQNISKSYGDNRIITGVSFKLQAGEKVGLIGPNGAGKTTLLKIIMGMEEPDEGRVDKVKGLSLAYLSQKPLLLPQMTLRAFFESELEDVFALRKEISELEKQMSLLSASEGDQVLALLMERYDKVRQLFELKDGYTLENRLQRVVTGMGFRESDLARRLAEFSGGEKTRAQLAALLLKDPALLILDEPTNYLDVDTVEWLENYLRSWTGALLVVSHDRYFLNRVVNRILLLDKEELQSYRGNYEAYSRQKQIDEATVEKTYKKQQRIIRKEQAFIRTATADSRTKRQARSREKRLEKMMPAAALQKDTGMHLNFGFAGRSGRMVVAFEQVAKSFGVQEVFAEADFKISWGDRVALVGPNGAGKTTLLRIVTGEEVQSKGRVRVGPAVRTSYFDQEQEELDVESTPLDIIMTESATEMKEGEVRNYLGRYLFRGEEVFKKIGDLSGGEKSRLALAKVALSDGNFLILDEPTSHLDIRAVEELESTLVDYPGTLLLVSHDRYFISRLANSILEIRDGRVKLYKVGYQEYVEIKAAEKKKEMILPETAEGKAKLAKTSRRRQREKEKEHRQEELALRRERSNLEKKLLELEEEIASAEEKVSFWERELAAPGSYNDFAKAKEMTAEFHAARDRVKELYQEWEKLTGLLESHP